MMINIVLPEVCTFANFARTVSLHQLDSVDWEKLTIKIPYYCYVDCATIAYLSAWIKLHQNDGRDVYFSGSPRVTQYLSRMDVFKFIDYEYSERFNRRISTGRFIPVKKIFDNKDVSIAVNMICDLISHHFDQARDILPAFEWTTNEIIDNIINHASITTPAALCAQFREDKSRLEIGIVDCGRGIKTSLDESQTLNDHRHALTEALKRGVTRDPNVGQGNGLAGSREIILKNHGTLCLWSGDAQYSIDKGRDLGTAIRSEIKGTAILLSLDITNAVDLGETFIGRSSWTYIESECERVSDQGGIKVVEECHDTATRDSARRLRRKILAMLPDMSEKLYINFSGVHRSSSSFLDELLGRLMLELGIDDFPEKVGVVHINSTLKDMANVVIRQRLYGLDNVPTAKKAMFNLKWPWK